MALLAGGMLAGNLLAKKRAGQQQAPLAPGPTDGSPAALTPPAPPIVNPADANAQALGAAQRQRKRTAAGSLLTSPMAPATSTPRVAPRFTPRSLLGS